jgi:hypothetical protein
MEKKNCISKEMEGISIQIQIIAGVVVIGALVETFFPGLIGEKLKNDLSALTIAGIGILFSFLLLMLLLTVRIREGFEDTEFQSKWSDIIRTNQVKEVCELYTKIYDRMLTVEKGAPPGEVKTDAQAREAVNARFASLMTTNVVDCKLVEEVSAANTMDGLYLILPKVSDDLLIQNYQTASACRSLLIDNYLQLQDAERQRKEGFQDVALCSDELAKEKREFKERKPLSKDAQTCLLVEEIPGEKKREVIQSKLNRIVRSFELYKQQGKAKDSLPKIFEDCKYYSEELEKKKQEAEATSNKYNW